MLTINEYYVPFDKAISELNNILGIVLFQLRNIPEEELILSDFDYYGYIKEIEDQIYLLKKMRVRYLFDRMDESEFEQVLARDSQGNLTIYIEYKIKQFDTLRTISLEFDVPESEILNYNNISMQDFWDKRERCDIIKIPKYIEQSERKVYENLAVFGSHSGTKAWGKDLPNDLAVINGKLKVLNNSETLKQGLLNMLGEYGSIPFYENFTFDPDWGREYPADFLEVFTKIKMERRLALEPRVQEVVNIESKKVKSGLSFTVILYPINVIKKKENEIELITG